MRTSDDLLNNELEISPVVENNLLDASKWGKFLAICGFITCALMVLAGAWIAWYIPSQFSAYNEGMRTGIFFVYLVIGVLFFFPCLFLLRFSVKIQTGLKEASQESVESAFYNLKAMFRYMGIITIIMMFFYLLALIGLMQA